MVDVVNPEEQKQHHHHDHGHDHDHGDDQEDWEEDEGEEDGEDGEDDEEEETDEQYAATLAAAKAKYKAEREAGYQHKQGGPFKHLFRSKGFIWLSNRPQLFFEWSQAAVACNIHVGGPWVCTLKGVSLEDQAREEDLGDRGQSLIFIGQNMGEYKENIIEELDRCLVTSAEWKEMLQNKLTQNVENDPFAESVQGIE